MTPKKRSVLALVMIVLLAILPALSLVLVVDPFQIYHRPFVRSVGLQENQRYQNAGLINQYLADPARGYDSVIVGTSMSQNFSGTSVARILGWKNPLRLLMPGAMAEEQLAVLRHALLTGRVEHVLLELHPFLYQDTYRQKKQYDADKTLYFPAYLYNETWRDDAPYVFNIDVLKMSWQILASQGVANVPTPESLGYWGDRADVASDHRAFNAPENIRKLREQTAGFHLTPLADAEIAQLAYPILDESLLPLLMQYCNQRTDFVLFVPPWPRFRYQKSEKLTLRSVYMPRHLLKGIASCANIHLYDFDLQEFAGDLDNYKDEQHYLPAINLMLLQHIARREDQLTLTNVQTFESRFVDMLNHYVVTSSYSPTGVPRPLSPTSGNDGG